MNKKTIRRIEDIINELDRGIAFINSEKTIIGRQTTGTDSNVWKDERGIGHHSITKEIGSELCLLFNARQHLKQLITPVVIETMSTTATLKGGGL